MNKTTENFEFDKIRTAVFWCFDQVCSTYWTGKIPAQSHVCFGVFFF